MNFVEQITSHMSADFLTAFKHFISRFYLDVLLLKTEPPIL